MSDTTTASAAASGASATERFQTDKSPYAAVADTPKERVDTLAREVLGAIHDTIRRHKVTYDEYNALKAWLIQVGQDGEWPLFLDVWIEHAVEDVATEHRAGSKGTIEGPYYVPNAPEQGARGTIPMREDEKGSPLVWTGRVTSTDGSRWPAPRSSSGTPTTTASTRSSLPASRSGTCAVPSRRTPTAPSRSPRCGRRRTRSPPTAPAAS